MQSPTVMYRAQSPRSQDDCGIERTPVLGHGQRKWYSRRNLQQDDLGEHTSSVSPQRKSYSVLAKAKSSASPQRKGHAGLGKAKSSASPQRKRYGMPGTATSVTSPVPQKRSLYTMESRPQVRGETSPGRSVTVTAGDSEVVATTASRCVAKGTAQLQSIALQPSKQPATTGENGLKEVVAVKPKTKAAPPPPPAPKARPKSSGPPAPPPKRGGPARAQSAANPAARIPAAAAPFGRKLHLIDASYESPNANSVFGSACSVEIDTSLLSEVLLKGGTSPSSPSRTRRASNPKEEEEIRVFSASRAQNTAILLRKLPISVAAICEHALMASFSPATGLRAEDLELLLAKFPTPEEAKKLLEHVNNVEALRDVEREILPLCSIPGAERRLRLFHAALVHGEQYKRIFDGFQCIFSAAEEITRSKRLHELLRTVLTTANYINYGSGSEGATSLPVRSLAAFASFKLGSGGSTLHYLCRTLCDASFMHDLQDELAHLAGAARQSVAALKQELAEFRALSKLAESQLEADSADAIDGNDDRLARPVGAADAAAGGSAGPTGRLQELTRALRHEFSDLEAAAQLAEMRVEEAQRFLGESSKKMPSSEEFFSHIAGFLELLAAAAAEANRNRARSASLAERGRGCRSSSDVQG